MEVPQDYNNFKRSLVFTLQHEVPWEIVKGQIQFDKNGGYTNDPDDPGGETKWGISKRYHPDVDIKNLTPDGASDIYYTDYWQRAGCGGIDFPLCTCVFDTAVNPGVSRSVRWARDATDVASFLALRKKYYIDRVVQNPKMKKYLGGWLNRVGDLQKFAQIAEQSDQGI